MKNIFKLCFITLFALPCLQADWCTVIGIESGVAISSHAGKSKTFPNDPLTSEFYSYSPNHKNQTRAVYGGYLGVQWQPSCEWKIQCNLHYNQTSSFSVNGTLTQGVDVQSQDIYDYSYKILVRQALLCTKLYYVNETPFQPYALLGVGVSFNRSYSFSTNVPSSLTFTRDYKSKTTSGLCYAVGAGVDYLISDNLLFGINYRFMNLGRASFGSSTIDDTPVSGTLTQNNFYANEVIAQLTLVF